MEGWVNVLLRKRGQVNNLSYSCWRTQSSLPTRGLVPCSAQVFDLAENLPEDLRSQFPAETESLAERVESHFRVLESKFQVVVSHF
jgi:hypothetical protein